MPGQQCALGHRRGGGGVRGTVGIGDDHRALAAEARERVLVLEPAPARVGRERRALMTGER